MTSLKYKIPIACFLIVAIFSLSLLGYTLYVTLGTKWALRSLSVSLSSVRVNESMSTAEFPLIICNPSNIRLAIFYLKAEIQFNNTGAKIKEWGGIPPPLELPANERINFTITIPVDNSTSYSNGVWNLKLRIILNTWLPQQSSVNRELTYGV